MHFQLEYDSDGRNGSWDWWLQTADGTVLARAPEAAASENEARKQITAFRKSAGGMKFAKVLSA